MLGFRLKTLPVVLPNRISAPDTGTAGSQDRLSPPWAVRPLVCPSYANPYPPSLEEGDRPPSYTASSSNVLSRRAGESTPYHRCTVEACRLECYVENFKTLTSHQYHFTAYALKISTVRVRAHTCLLSGRSFAVLTGKSPRRIVGHGNWSVVAIYWHRWTV